MNNWTKLVVGAVVAGLMGASTIATANHPAGKKDEKHGKKKCGKCGQKDKKGKAAEGGEHPADQHPADQHPAEGSTEPGK